MTELSFCCVEIFCKKAKNLLLKTRVLLFTWRFCVPHFTVWVHSHPSLGKPRMCKFQWENQSLSHTLNKKFFFYFLPFFAFFSSAHQIVVRPFTTQQLPVNFFFPFAKSLSDISIVFPRLLMAKFFLFEELLVLFIDLLVFNLHFHPKISYFTNTFT